MCSFDLNDDFEGIDHDTYGTPNSSLLKKIREAGFKPIAITVLLCEETFIFKGKEETQNAADMFLPEGWWYDFSSWVLTREEYVKKFYEGDDDLAPTVYWLDKNFEPKK
jgi:hypothetical protein